MKQIEDDIKPLDIVALLIDAPRHGLRRGDVGTVVEVLEATEHHPHGYIVEFIEDDGSTRALLDVTNAAEIMPLHFKFNREAA